MLVEMLLVSGVSLVARSASRMVSASRLAAAGICNAGHQNGELVAAETRHHLALVEHRGDARSDRLKHRVAGGVAEQIVDFLEPVEIEAEHGEAFAARSGRRFPGRSAR